MWSGLGLVGETLADADRGEVVSLGLPTKEQAGVLSPTAPLCAPQDHTEAVLLGYARSLGAEVEFGREVLRVDVADDGAEALVRNGDRIRGRERAVRDRRRRGPQRRPKRP